MTKGGANNSHGLGGLQRGVVSVTIFNRVAGLLSSPDAIELDMAVAASD